MAAYGEHREEAVPSAQMGNLSLGSAASALTEVEICIASVKRDIEEVARSINLVSGKIVMKSTKIEMTLDELNQADETSEKYKNLSLFLQSEVNEKAKLLEKEAKLLEKEAKLMDKEAKLMDKEARLVDKDAAGSEVQRSTRSTQPQPKAQVVMTPAEQSKASSYASNTFAHGFGFLPSSYHFDPTFQLRVWSLLVPNEEDLFSVAEERAKGLVVLGELGNLLYQGEDSTDGVRPMLDSFLQVPQLSSSGSQLNVGGGIVNATSKPDFLWTVHGSPLGVLEVKGGSSSVLSALRQAAVTATNIAVNLLDRGHSAEEIVVPVAGSTGRLMQFGAVIVLDPSFPTFLPTSHILDLARDGDNALANAYLMKASKWVKVFGATLRPHEGAQTVKMALSLSNYHIKKLNEETLKRGLGLFSSSSDPGVLEVGPGLAHMGRVLNKLFAHPSARTIAVFPLSVRSPTKDTKAVETGCYWLVYDDLASKGFRIGTPDRLKDSNLYERFLNALRQGISHIHEAGVIHCDLYPSNIMWKADAAEGEDVEIRIIDWDNAHCIDEQDFGEKCRDALMDHKPTRSAKFGTDHDWKYLSVLTSDINSGDEELWKKLASNNKEMADDAFYGLFPAF